MPPTFPQALRLWLKIGLLSFGGPAAQISLLHDEVVEKKKWVSEDHFQHALRFCAFLPGPEAQQLATCCGWFVHGLGGGLAAGFLFFLPAAVLLWALSWLYAACGQMAQVTAVFHGLKAAVLAILFAALVRLMKKSLKGAGAYAIALLAFAGLVQSVPFPLVIALAALAGWLLSRHWPQLLPLGGMEQDAPLAERAWGWRKTLGLLAVGLLLWWGPVVAAGWWLGHGHFLAQQGLFFSQASCVTFGGAYAVLPFVARHAIDAHWVNGAQMLDGLALAETTPGPLIIVLEFFGFQGGWKNPGSLAPLPAGTLGALMTLWATFAPSTLFALLGAPHLEKVRQVRWLAGALAGISAAVIGVIASLGVWMGWKMLWPADGHTDWFILILAPLAFVMLQWRKWPMGVVLAVCALAGFF